MDNYFSKILRRLADELDGFFKSQKIDQKLIMSGAITRDPGSPFGDLDAEPVPDGMDPDLFIDLVDAMGLNKMDRPPGKISTDLDNKKSAGEGAGKTGHAAAEILKEEPPMPSLKRGSVTKRKDGRWMGRFYEEKKVISVYAPTKTECIMKTNEEIQKSDLRVKEHTVSTKMTLQSWFDTWIDVYKNGKRKASTVLFLRTTTKKVLRAIGAMQVSKITAIDVERALNTVPAAAMKLRSFTILQECLDALVKNRTIKENPVRFAERPEKPDPREKFIPSAHEFDTFLERMKEISPKYALFAAFLEATGLRVGEALALEWSDVDWQKGSIRINKAFNRTEKEALKPKTKNSIRIIPLFPKARKALLQLNHEGREVFGSIGKTAWPHNFRNAAAQSGFPKLTVHCLRHTFTTRCMEAGVDPKVIQKWLGHSKIDLTMNIYAHVGADFEGAQVEKLAKYSK